MKRKTAAAVFPLAKLITLQYRKILSLCTKEVMHILLEGSIYVEATLPSYVSHTQNG